MKDLQTTLSYKWFTEVWTNSREDMIDELMHEDCEAHGLTPSSTTGREAFKEFYNGFRSIYKDVVIEVKRVISEDDMEVSHCECSAVHRETGTKVNFTGMCMARIKDGKLAEGWNEFDFLSVYRQLGLLAEK